MSTTATIRTRKKTRDTAIAAYYARLAELAASGATKETTLRSAFEALLTTLGREHSDGPWTFQAEYGVGNRRRIDGALIDSFKMPRGFWEAKDQADNLEAEIVRKTELGYPLRNTIFEDTRTAILYQNGARLGRYDLTDRTQLAALLETFFAHTDQQIESFEKAVKEFQERVPELAAGLEQLIEQERTEPRSAFEAAFQSFLQLCQQAINPNISADAIEKMLVQHLLTERLFRTVFKRSDFTRQNAIANQIEHVITQLTQRVGGRDAYLRKLDPFYEAIEAAATTITDPQTKQDFLNTVYERFFQGYSREQADTHGIVYTPQALVRFMWASVAVVLREQFQQTLATPGVKILDPCTGTGNFIVSLLEHLHATDPATLKAKYTDDLFANEVMLLPYYIASQNIEQTYRELTNAYQPFTGLCFVDTLDLYEGRQQQLGLFAEANTARIQRETAAELTVIIGNPPYNVGQLNENDNNKNRTYPVVDQRIRETYAQASRATNKNVLSDMYVKFFRWATDRLRGTDGIICFVSNNSFVDGVAFDGMRRYLAQEFTTIYHLDLGGNSRRASDGSANVFGIRVGVGITLAVRRRASDSTPQPPAQICYARISDELGVHQKLDWLIKTGSIANVLWQTITPDARHTWRTEGLAADFESFLPLGSKAAKAGAFAEAQAIFGLYSLGVSTNRDTWVYNYQPVVLRRTIERMIETYNSEVDRWKRRADQAARVDDFVPYDDTRIKWSESLKARLQRIHYIEFNAAHIRTSLYRPFCRQYLYFDRALNERVYQFPSIFPTPASEAENVVICVAGIGDRKGFGCLVSNCIPNLDLSFEKTQCFPYYVYAEDGSGRRENITAWAVAQFGAHYGRDVGRWEIFDYVYALLHHPTYRTRYAANLKRDLPHIPLLGDSGTLARLAAAGRRLRELHLTYEQAAVYPLRREYHRAVPYTPEMQQLRLSKDKQSLGYNASLTLHDIPPQCYEYRLGGRSALEWVVDQYRVKTDARSGITNDPNRYDDPEYILNLIGRVITVSLATVQLVAEIAAVELA
ncbi:MAG: N-6 DNA methylase [Chloroflexaceae bacterium]|nr:N-6 DNA methylase [Chloroflexaceae bacterium]